MEKILHENGNNKKNVVVAIPIPDKVDFRNKGYNKRQQRTQQKLFFFKDQIVLF